MPDGDPEALELMAARLEVAAAGVADLGNSTRQVTGSIRSGADWYWGCRQRVYGFH